ncbi:fibronectin type III domain-containing protein [Geodermatophilus ruber]|uniref:Fibronectin type III domain-containing protein n=1 Tax=Geodermatophilus ruber TaxID=504800 RepID=A0A1I4DF16_9ACTN|nr:fibronectin type III domain-containing protein [Geodermatophilus ruber]SFK92042.1 Fibronectin type III domain-containing protein [Geodermatophilus ruber]
MRRSESLPAAPARARRHSLSILAAAAATLCALQVQVPTAARAADPTPITYQGPAYPVAGPSPTEDKPQSKLWFTDGSWWALMRTSAGITIHRLVDHAWQDTGTLVDERIASTGDALWEGNRLYVASRVSGGALRAVRFSYDPATDTYTREVNQQVASNGTESMSIARDSLGRLWITYTQGSRVYVAHTTTDDRTWTAPFAVPVPDSTITADDIAGIIAFRGRIGVMWSDQGNDVVRFAVHEDTAPDSTWTVEDALAGPNLADDHINLKSLVEDDQGRIFAAVKTSRGDAGEPPTDPSIVVLQRASDGTWTSATASTVADRLTRPQIALDTSNNRLHLLMSTEAGGTVYHKSTPLGALSFAGGKGTPFVEWPGARINDASTTKQPVNATTGLVVLASDDTALRYYHGELSLGGIQDTTPPSSPQQVQATATSASTVTVTWQASTDDTGVTGYRIFRDGTQVGTSTSTSFSDTGLTAGTSYAYTVAAADAAGNVSAPSQPARVTPAQPPSGSVEFVGAATASGTGTGTSVPGPAGVRSGDVLLAAVSHRGTATITPGAGWTLVRSDTASTTVRQAVYVKVATSSDAASTWTLSRAQTTVVQVLAYRGIDTGSPVIGSAGATTTTADIAHPAVASATGAPVVTVAAIARATTLQPAAPLSELSEAGAPSTAQYALTADTAATTATGTSSGAHVTRAGAAAGGVGQTVSLRPGSGGGGGTAGDTTAPSAPAQLTATPASPSSVALSWQPATDDVGVTGYRVFRDGAQIAVTAGTTFSDTGLRPATTYAYTVAATDAAGNVSAQSPAVPVTTPSDSPPPPQGAVSFVGAASANGTTASTAVAGPAGIRAGDVLVAAVSTRGAPTITAPAGWTLVRQDTSGTTMRQALYVKVATDGDGSSTWTLNRAQATVVQVLAYRGVNTTAPVVASAGALTSTAALVSPAVTAVDGATVLVVAGIARQATLSPDGTLTERSENASTSSTYKVSADASETVATSTTAGPYTTTASGGASGIAQTIALRPSA